jgi:5-methylcytosine-specific restriction protein A
MPWQGGIMARTKGHGNPKWNLEETILALDLYFDCEANLPSAKDRRVKDLSLLLRSLPFHPKRKRKQTFRNADGVSFKLQNIRQIATGIGLSNTSAMDRQVWKQYGQRRQTVKAMAEKIRQKYIGTAHAAK